MKAESREQLVRGKIIFSQWGAGCVSEEAAKDENNIRVTKITTPWHRHDEDLSILDTELNTLTKVISNFKSIDSLMIGYEYRDYKR